MKTLKSKFIIPMMAIAMALTTSMIGAAESLSEAATPVMIGYISNVPGQPCQSVNVECNPFNGQICTFNNKNVFEQNGTTGCTRQLYKN